MSKDGYRLDSPGTYTTALFGVSQTRSPWLQRWRVPRLRLPRITFSVIECGTMRMARMLTNSGMTKSAALLRKLTVLLRKHPSAKVVIVRGSKAGISGTTIRF